MKLFQITQKNLAILGINPNQSTQKYPFNGRNMLCFFLFSSFIILTAMFLLYEAHSFREYTESIYTITGTIVCTVAFTSTIFKIQMLFNFIAMSEDIVDMKYFASKTIIISETNQRVEKWSKIIFFVLVKVAPLLGILSRLAGTIYFYLTTDLGREAYELPVPMWVPFDWKNPFGYLIAVTWQYIVAIYAVTFLACIATLGFGAFLFAVTVNNISKQSLEIICKKAKHKSDQSHLLEHLFEFIQSFSSVKQLIGNFLEIYQPFILMLFLWSLVTMCSAMLMIQVEISHHESSPLMLLVTFIEVAYAFGLLCVACELGEKFSNLFNDICVIVEQFNWYLFPIEMQRLLPIILINVQRPVVIECFGSILCDRNAFKSMIKTAFSYFMVLRHFNK